MILPINILAWVNSNRHLLKPPIGNKQLFAGEDFIIMAVGGPNVRTDYHYNETEEFFIQLEGDIIVKIQEDNKSVSIPVRQGEIFLLPAKAPHSPVRPEGTVGLVVERRRRPGDKDGLIWYCEKCNNKLFEKYFILEDIERDFLPVFIAFSRSVELRTCSDCGHVMEPDPRYL